MREILTAFTSGDSQVATIDGLRKCGVIAGVYGNGDYQPGSRFDATPPPSPTGLSSGGALASIILSWDASTYKNLSHTEIWRAQTNDFSQAQLIGRGDGRIYVDNVGAAAVRYYWIRYVSQGNIPGPFNAQAGTRGETGIDATYLLSVMAGKITASQLHTTLGERINLIDAPGTGLVAKAVSNQTSINGLNAQIFTKIDANGYICGYGLDSTANKNEPPTSSFAVRADQFYIASPSGPGVAPAMPFIVRTTATTINGVAVPFGVYIADAFIANGTITNAKIGDAAINNAKIANLDAGKITTGYIDAARISVGSLDAKIANIDAAVISSGYINSARINTASIARASISLAQIDRATVTSLSALTATIGTLRTASTGARLEISDNVIKVFDGVNDFPRVKIGNLSL